MEELKRCPLCNGKAILLDAKHHMENFINKPTIVCQECYLSLEDINKLRLIKKWNTRKPIENALKRMERRLCPDWNRKWVSAMLTAIEILKEETF